VSGDFINAIFEAGTAFAISRNVRAVLKDREVKGVRPSNTLFFLAWGIWNVWFYPANGFTWSWLAGMLVVAANVVWLAQVIRFAPIGTRSVLYGVHAFWLHPFLITIGWWRLYGFPWDPRLWVAFFVHDLGYWGKPNMDGPEGESHPELGAAIMRRWFGEEWGDFCLCHSRCYAKRINKPVSRLCHADKYVIILEPTWLYLPRTMATGEVWEFIEVARKRADVIHGPSDPLNAAERADFASGEPRRWHRSVKSYMRRWLTEHKDGAADTWTRVRHKGEAFSQ
jgi:hypothetical protein